MANAIQELILRIGGDSSGGQQAVKDLANVLSGAMVKALKDMGDQSAAAGQKVNESAAALDHAKEATGGWIPLLQELGHSWVARIAEGELLRDAVHEVIDKLKEMVLILPELAIKGAVVADVEKNFERLTDQAGLLGSTLLGTLRTGTHGTITDFDLMKRANQDLAAGMHLTDQQFGTLAQGAFALAKATGTDVKTALDTMSDAMLTGRTRSLALLTGKIDLKAAEETYAASIGSTADHLTAEGKIEAARQAILERVGATTDRLGEQTDGLKTRVDQARVAWANFEEDLGKTIATSAVLKTGMDGIHDGLVTAFGGTQQALIDAIASKVEALEIAIIELARAGVTAGGALATEWYALSKVFMFAAQALDEVSFIGAKAQAVEFGAIASLGHDTIAAARAKAGADEAARLNDVMAARLKAFQEADAAQQAIGPSTAKYTALLDALVTKMQNARDTAASYVGPLEAGAIAEGHAAEAAGHHAEMLQASKKEMEEAAKLAKELAAARKEALDAAIPLTAMQQAEASGLLALDVSYKAIAKDIGAAEIQVKKFAEAQKAAAADEQKAQTEAYDLERHLDVEVGKLREKQDAADKKHRDEINAGRDKAIVDSLADIKKMQEAAEDADLSVVDAHVRAIERKRDAEIQAVQNSLLLEGHLKDERIRLITETADREISQLDRVTNWWKGGVEHQMMPLNLAKGVSQVTTEVDRLSQAFGNLGHMAGGIFGELLTGAGQAFSAISAYEKAVQQYGSGSVEASQAKSDAIYKSIGIGAGIVAQNINTGAGASRTALVAQGVASGVSAGSVGGGWGMLAGGVAGGLLGWYQSGVEWRKAIGDVSRDFGGLKIPEDFAKAIEDIESTTGLDRIRALTTQLAKLIEIAGGLNADNFTLFYNKLHDAFSYLQNNTMTIAQVTQTVDSVFDEFARVGTDAYGRINDQVRELIDLDAHYQTQSQAIVKWMQGQAATMAAALNDLLTQPMIVADAAVGQAVKDAQKALDDLKATGTATIKQLTDAQNVLTAALEVQHQEAVRNKQALDDLATITLATFNAAIASGDTFLEALLKISPALATIKKAYEDLGLAIDDATIKGLLLEDTILRGTPDKPSSLGVAIAANQASFTAGTNLGPYVETPGVFAAQQRSTFSLYTQAQAASEQAGVTGPAGTAAALLPFQATLHEQAEWAKKQGIELDHNTQMMIDQSRELGIWSDDVRTDGEKTRDSIENLIKSNDALATALGGLPQALADVIAHRPPPGSSDGSGTGTPPPPSGAFRGGLVTAFGVAQYLESGGTASNWPWIPQGTDTVPAMLTPGERVLSLGQTRAFDAARSFLPGDGASVFPWPAAPATPTQGDVYKTYNVTISASTADQLQQWRDWLRKDGVEIAVEEFEDGRYVSRVNRALDR